jgi:hypothetical protein
VYIRFWKTREKSKRACFPEAQQQYNMGAGFEKKLNQKKEKSDIFLYI